MEQGRAFREAGKLTGQSLPFNQTGYIRALGKASGGMYNSSTSQIESIRQYYNAVTAAGIYSISGKVTGRGVSGGVTMTLSRTGAETITTTTNSLGVYTFSGLYNGDYTVTPFRSGFTFTPANREVTISGANVLRLNFNAARQ